MLHEVKVKTIWTVLYLIILSLIAFFFQFFFMQHEQTESSQCVEASEKLNLVTSDRRWKLLPACKVSSSVSLEQDDRPADLLVTNSLQPPAHGLLDLDASRAEFVRSELLQICYLSGPEEDLCLSELEHVRVLEETRQEAGSEFGNSLWTTAYWELKTRKL